MADEFVRRIQIAYPKIYLACHQEHPRARTNAHRISARDSAVLAHLSEREPMAPHELAKHLGVRRSTLSPALTKLEALGYISCRARTDDMRRLDVLLTPLGAGAMQGSSVLDTGLLQRVVASLPVAQRERAVRGLELLAQAAFQTKVKS